MIVYLHGFLSSPQSFKAELLKERLAALGRANEWCCPTLLVSPFDAIALIEREIAQHAKSSGDSNVTMIGSSLGGYYATYLAQKHGWRAVLLNPVIVPQRDLSSYLGEQALVHGGRVVVEQHHLDELGTLHVDSVAHPERYYLIAATGDQMLDYREMLAHYPGARTKLIEGSDHGISEFADYVDEVIAFCDERSAA